jgi:hypothetical protein
LIPSAILFIASNAVDVALQIGLGDENSCPEFDRWQQMKGSDIDIDFRRIQRIGFEVPSLEDYIINVSTFEDGLFSGTERAGDKDIQGFASILYEIMFGCPPPTEGSIPTGIPGFVSGIIKSCLSLTSKSSRSFSFHNMLDILLENNFKIEKGVDSAEVLAFVSWVESAEYPDQ